MNEQRRAKRQFAIYEEPEEILEDVVIDVTLIPDHVAERLAATFYECVFKCFQQPGAQEKLEKLMAESQQKQALTAPKLRKETL